MAKKKKTYDDDDGRPIADMSEVKRPNLFGIQPAYMDESSSKPEKNQDEEPKEERPWEDSSMRSSERLAFLGGAMKASILIGLVYIAVFGVFIWLLTRVL